MRRLMIAAVLVLVSSVAYALPTCWDCFDFACEHSLGYPFKSCWAGPGYCVAGGGECATLTPENQEPWLISDWQLASVKITVEGPRSESAEIAQNEAPSKSARSGR